MQDWFCIGDKMDIQICAIFVIDKLENQDLSLLKMKGRNERKLFVQG